MAHPYKQKYNNFNGPGHQSPANNIIGKEIGKRIVKPVIKKLDDLWKATKNSFVSRKFDNSIDWTKTKSKIGKLTIGGTLINQGVSGVEKERERVVNAIVQDNIQEPKNVKIINDKFKINKDKEVNLDSILKANR
tara:strand:- start:206 stop:610 length:405 start_codon:yes stop_codon:yes gene_type:complete